MSIESLYAALTTGGFNVHYGKAPNGTKCPYVVMSEITHPNFAADNATYTKTTSLRLVLVESESHDWELIGDLEAVLDGIPLPYSETDVVEPTERVCETYFDITFLGGTQDA